MNKLPGTILDIIAHEGISLVMVKIFSQTVCTSIVLDTPETASYLEINNEVNLIFKETEVILSKDLNLNISIQNKLLCRVQRINLGVLLSEIELSFGDATIRSIITSNACKQLALKESDKVVALIKTNEVSLSPHD